MKKGPELLKYWESLSDEDWEKIEFLARNNGDQEKAKWDFIRTKERESKIDFVSETVKTFGQDLLKFVAWLGAGFVGLVLVVALGVFGWEEFVEKPKFERMRIEAEERSKRASAKAANLAQNVLLLNWEWARSSNDVLGFELWSRIQNRNLEDSVRVSVNCKVLKNGGVIAFQGNFRSQGEIAANSTAKVKMTRDGDEMSTIIAYGEAAASPIDTLRLDCGPIKVSSFGLFFE